MTEEQLTALLRIKRYEQPPEGYFDQLLKDVHRRQRAELLRRPLWRIALERVQTIFSEHSMGPIPYVAGLASMAVAGVVAIGLIAPAKRGETVVLQSAEVRPAVTEKILTIQPMGTAPSLVGVSPNSTQVKLAPVGSRPRYVMDARPVSYESSSSFKF